jgi:anti-sigma factor RsiW
VSRIDDALREELSALVDGALEEPRASELRARLAADEALRSEYEAIRSVAEAVRGLPREPAPQALAARVRAGLPRARRLPLLLGAAAALAAGVLVALALPSGSGAPGRDRRLAKTEPSPARDSRVPEPVAEAAPRGIAGPSGAVPPGLRAPPAADLGTAAEEASPRAARDSKAERTEEQASISPARAGAPVRTVEERAAYFARLRAMKPEELRRHIEGFAPPPERERAYARDAPAETVLASLEEAQTVRALLLAAFPPADAPKAARGAAAPPAGAEVAGPRWRSFPLSLDAPPPSRAGVRGWLAHLSTGTPPPRPPPPSADPAAVPEQERSATLPLKLYFPAPDAGR